MKKFVRIMENPTSNESIEELSNYGRSTTSQKFLLAVANKVVENYFSEATIPQTYFDIEIKAKNRQIKRENNKSLPKTELKAKVNLPESSKSFEAEKLLFLFGDIVLSNLAFVTGTEFLQSLQPNVRKEIQGIIRGLSGEEKDLLLNKILVKVKILSMLLEEIESKDDEQQSTESLKIDDTISKESSFSAEEQIRIEKEEQVRAIEKEMKRQKKEMEAFGEPVKKSESKESLQKEKEVKNEVSRSGESLKIDDTISKVSKESSFSAEEQIRIEKEEQVRAIEKEMKRQKKEMEAFGEPVKKSESKESLQKEKEVKNEVSRSGSPIEVAKKSEPNLAESPKSIRSVAASPSSLPVSNSGEQIKQNVNEDEKKEREMEVRKAMALFGFYIEPVKKLPKEKGKSSSNLIGLSKDSVKDSSTSLPSKDNVSDSSTSLGEKKGSWLQKLQQPKDERKALQKTKSKEISQFLKEEKAKFQKLKNEPKLLILGTSDSGKSTLLRQLTLLHGGGFLENEKLAAQKGIVELIALGCNAVLSKLPESLKNVKLFNQGV
jgi:Zn-finger nucleic acid-binding protein